VLLVTRLDHLARSTRDLLNILAGIVEKGAGFRWLSDIWAGTTTALGRLMPTILGGLAEFERDLFQPALAKVERALKNGVKLGREPKLTPHQIREVVQRRRHRQERAAEFAGREAVSLQLCPMCAAAGNVDPSADPKMITETARTPVLSQRRDF
jgi:DNA invertase Pin-like site-specific DNA recombinase